MDVIDASHFEKVKEFVRTTDFIFKLRYQKKNSTWIIEFIAPHDYEKFSASGLGVALKGASTWIATKE